MSEPVESQFEDYCSALAAVLGHADRHQPAKLYLKGLLLSGERKSVEPMAARLCPENVRSGHQSMNHLVAAADWGDHAVLGDYRQYLPEEWTGDRARCHKAGVPENIEFRTKGQIAREQVARALANNIPRGIVLADAGYGTGADFRDWLQTQKLDFVLGIRNSASVWWRKHQPADIPEWSAEGRPQIRRDARHQPVSLLYVARALLSKMWRNWSSQDYAEVFIAGFVLNRFAVIARLSPPSDR